MEAVGAPGLKIGEEGVILLLEGVVPRFILGRFLLEVVVWSQ